MPSVLLLYISLSYAEFLHSVFLVGCETLSLLSTELCEVLKLSFFVNGRAWAQLWDVFEFLDSFTVLVRNDAISELVIRLPSAISK